MLNLHKVPFVFVVVCEQIVEHRHIAVIGETEVAYSACLTLGEQEVEHAVVDIPFAQHLHAVVAHTHGVEQIIVDVIRLQLL